MLLNLNQRMTQLCGLLSLVSLLLASTSATIATAQPVVDDSHNVVEVPLHELTQIQQELKYLRARDAERQAWEESIVNQLTTIDSELAEEDSAPDEDGPDFPAYGECDCCDCCRCYPCQCPLPEAPCIECPHVSTVNPYFNVQIFGALKTDMLFSTARSVSPGTPFFLFPGSAAGFDESTVSVHARQSTLAAAFTGPQFHGFQSGGLVVGMFFNDAVVVDQYGFLPLQAYGELTNEDWRFAAGLQFDVFSPGIPTVLPFSALAASGNSGNSFRGQVRLERFLHPSDDVQWTLQLALSDPIASTIDPAFRALEDNGWPNVEGRVALGLGPLEGAGLAAKRPFEVGVSSVVGQIRTTNPGVIQAVADVWGLSVDFRWKVNDCFGVQGELFTGKTLGTYSGGILQNINTLTFQGIRSSGGFGEVFLYWTPCLHSHIGYGIDDPVDRDIAVLGRTRNSTIFANVLWDWNQTFRLGFEFTWRETDYKTLRDNEGAGFHTQFQWAF
jgi:hypothetical protein